jgi:hypothetical protein
VALAARLFSTDDTHELILVKPEHVRDAVAFMDRLYGMTALGYAECSREALADAAEARDRSDDIKEYLVSRHGLAKFLRNAGRFKRQDLEETLNMSRDEASGVINTLWDCRMVRREGGDVRVEPTLHGLLREVSV